MNPALAPRALPLGTLRSLFGALALVASLAGCTAMNAQNPSSAMQPVNAVADGDDARVILKGADVVAYFTQQKYVQGNPQLKSVYQDVTFRFSSPEHKAMFDQEPAKYLPQFNGYCTNGITYGIPWGGNADVWKMIDGKLYVFGGEGSKAAFELDEKANLAHAHKLWTEEIAGHNSFIRRAWRMVFRVPHYKTDAELQAMVAAAKGGAKPQ
jgi:YHS domain-containing protein